MWPVLKSFGEERICYSKNDSRSEIEKVYLRQGNLDSFISQSARFVIR